MTQQFGAAFKPADVALINDIIHRYLTMVERRKHEIMNDTVYHPEHFGEADALLADTEWISTTAHALRERCPFRVLPGFVELVYYPAVATANLMRTWILSGKNHLYAQQNRLAANHLADLAAQGIQQDRDIVDDFHAVGDRRFDGFGLSEHFGFRHWAADDNQYPVRHYITPATLPRMIVTIPGTTQYNVGSTWIGNRIELPDFQRLDVTQAVLVIATGSQDRIHYSIDNPLPWLHFSQLHGVTENEAKIYLTIDRTKIAGQTSGTFYVHGPNDALVEVVVLLPAFQLAAVPDKAFVPAGGIISMNAAHYTSSGKAGDAAFRILEPYGKTGSAVKVYPNGQDYRETSDRPWVAYRFYAPQAGQYAVTFCLAPTNPSTDQQEELIGYRLNEGPVQVANTVQEPGRKFTNSDQWMREAQDDVKKITAQVDCQAGLNTLTYYAVSGHMILEKIILVEAGRNLPKSYLGPTESVFHRH